MLLLQVSVMYDSSLRALYICRHLVDFYLSLETLQQMLKDIKHKEEEMKVEKRKSNKKTKEIEELKGTQRF